MRTNRMSLPETVRPGKSEFDEYANDYDGALNKGLAITGEAKEYYAEGRVKWLKRVLGEQGQPVGEMVLDFGCGTGTSASVLLEGLGCREYVGYDPSADSIDQARKLNDGLAARFTSVTTEVAEGMFDLAFCNGVFHHIPIEHRAEAAAMVWRSLKPGGVFAFWENNPWNPMVVWIMSKVPFDRDAIMLFPANAMRLLRGAGFEIQVKDYQFVFPKSLAMARGLEPSLRKLPLGGQYLILAKKPVR